MAPPVVDERRLDLGANLGRVAAARMEPAAARRVDRARHVPLEHDPLALRGQVRIRHRDGREQRLRVRHDRPLVQLLGRRQLHELAEIHDGDPVADVADDAEVVGDEDVRQLELVLKILRAGSASATGSRRRAPRPARRRRRASAGARAPARSRSAGAGRPRTRAGSGCSARARARPSRAAPRPAPSAPSCRRASGSSAGRR